MSWTTGLQVRKERVATVPVWKDDAKRYLQIDLDVDDHDDLLNVLINSAFEAVERYCGVSMVETQITISWDELHTTEELPYGPVRSIAELTGCEVKGELPGFVRVKGTGISAKVEYTAGYINIPEPLKLAVMKLVTDNFEGRTGYDMSGRQAVQILPNNWKESVKSYRRISWLA